MPGKPHMVCCECGFVCQCGKCDRCACDEGAIDDCACDPNRCDDCGGEWEKGRDHVCKEGGD